MAKLSSYRQSGGGDIKDYFYVDDVNGADPQNYTMVSRTGAMVDTTNGPVYITLPLTPAADTLVRFISYADTYSTNNFTIKSNGHYVNGVVQDIVVTTNGLSFDMVYVDGVIGYVAVDIGSNINVFPDVQMPLTMDAIDVVYDNAVLSPPLLVAVTGQGAIDELATTLNSHVVDTVDAHDATAISFDPVPSSMVATNVQTAIDELAARAGGGIKGDWDVTPVGGAAAVLSISNGSYNAGTGVLTSNDVSASSNPIDGCAVVFDTTAAFDNNFQQFLSMQLGTGHNASVLAVAGFVDSVLTASDIVPMFNWIFGVPGSPPTGFTTVSFVLYMAGQFYTQTYTNNGGAPLSHTISPISPVSLNNIMTGLLTKADISGDQTAQMIYMESSNNNVSLLTLSDTTIAAESEGSVGSGYFNSTVLRPFYATLSLGPSPSHISGTFTAQFVPDAVLPSITVPVSSDFDTTNTPNSQTNFDAWFPAPYTALSSTAQAEFPVDTVINDQYRIIGTGTPYGISTTDDDIIVVDNITPSFESFRVTAYETVAASAVSYINASSPGLVATTVQGAIDELGVVVETHIGDAVDAHDASAVSYDPTYPSPDSGLVATNVQAAIDELATSKQSISEKSQANGYASLDSSGLVPLAELPISTQFELVYISSATDITSNFDTYKGKHLDATTSGMFTDLYLHIPNDPNVNGSMLYTPHGTGMTNTATVTVAGGVTLDGSSTLIGDKTYCITCTYNSGSPLAKIFLISPLTYTSTDISNSSGAIGTNVTEALDFLNPTTVVNSSASLSLDVTTHSNVLINNEYTDASIFSFFQMNYDLITNASVTYAPSPAGVGGYIYETRHGYRTKFSANGLTLQLGRGCYINHRCIYGSTHIIPKIWNPRTKIISSGGTINFFTQEYLGYLEGTLSITNGSTIVLPSASQWESVANIIAISMNNNVYFDIVRNTASAVTLSGTIVGETSIPYEGATVRARYNSSTDEWYVAILNPTTAFDISYDPTLPSPDSGLVATNVQAAIDELASMVIGTGNVIRLNPGTVSYSVTNADLNNIIVFNDPGACSFILPDTTIDPFPDGGIVTSRNKDVGVITVSSAGTGTFEGSGTATTNSKPFTVYLEQGSGDGNEVWVIAGDM